MAEIGWQGIRITVPDDWEPGEFGGDRDSGHIRIDAISMQRAVIRWMSAESTRDLFKRSDNETEAVEKVMDNYLKALQKAERKQKRRVDIDRGTRLLTRRQTGKKAIRSYSWACPDDGRVGQGIVWYCEDCERTVIAEVDGTKEEDLRSKAAEVLATLSDHPTDDWTLWAVFGLRAQVPSEFKLENSVMMGGRVELRLEDDDKQVVSLQRWVANVALRGGDLESWAKRDVLQPMTRQYSLQHECEEVMGHEGLIVDGRKKGVRDHLAFMIGRVRNKERPFFLDGRIWHCVPENKLFTLHTLTGESNRDLIDRIQERVQCHTEP